ncbi:aldehyde dehydrogenase isoform 1, partial [Danaus plexippus plexippus]
MPASSEQHAASDVLVIDIESDNEIIDTPINMDNHNTMNGN